MVARFDTHSRLDPMRKYQHLEIDVASSKPFMHWTRLQCVEDADDMTTRTTRGGGCCADEDGNGAQLALVVVSAHSRRWAPQLQHVWNWRRVLMRRVEDGAIWLRRRAAPEMRAKEGEKENKRDRLTQAGEVLVGVRVCAPRSLVSLPPAQASHLNQISSHRYSCFCCRSTERGHRLHPSPPNATKACCLHFATGARE